MNYKEIHIGAVIKSVVECREVDIERLCKFFDCSCEDVQAMYNYDSLSSKLLLKWSKVLEYDFFRIYSQHLILYSPSKNLPDKAANSTCNVPQFRKNIYTKEIISYVIEQINEGKMTIPEVIERYSIPKTTLYKWVKKYSVTVDS